MMVDVRYDVLSVKANVLSFRAGGLRAYSNASVYNFMLADDRCKQFPASFLLSFDNWFAKLRSLLSTLG